MTTFYIFQESTDGVYKITTESGDNFIAQFETTETSNDAILRVADQCMISNGKMQADIQITYSF